MAAALGTRGRAQRTGRGDGDCSFGDGRSGAMACTVAGQCADAAAAGVPALLAFVIRGRFGGLSPGRVRTSPRLVGGAEPADRRQSSNERSSKERKSNGSDLTPLVFVILLAENPSRAMHRTIRSACSVATASLARCTVAPRSSRAFHSGAPARFLARNVSRAASSPASSSDPAPHSDPAASNASRTSGDDDADADAARALLASSYFPFSPSIPAAFPLQGFPLCRAAYGGTLRPGTHSLDSSRLVQSYVRLGGNFVEMQRSVSFDLIDAFAEVISQGAGQGQVVLAASVSAADVMAFVESEEQRHKALQARLPPKIVDGRRVAPPPFVSELRGPAEPVPKSLQELLPMLPRVFPHFLRHFLALHDLDSLDLLMLDPPPVNTNAGRVPDESFAWMGGVERSVATQEGFLDFVSAWFLEFERSVRQGLIKSYGLSTARITLAPSKDNVPHGAELYVSLARVLEAAKQASTKAGPMSAELAANVSEAAQRNGHNLSTLKFPFSLFSAHRLLSPGADEPSSFFHQVRSQNLLTLGENPFDDCTPLPTAEWFRFAQQPDPPASDSSSDESAPPSKPARPSDAEAALPVVSAEDESSLPERYATAMGTATTLEGSYKLLVAESKLPEESLPPRVPDLSWASLIHTLQSDLFASQSWETLVHRRLRPTLDAATARLKMLEPHPRLREWAHAYQRAMQPVIQTFGGTRVLAQRALSRKVCRALDSAVPKLRAFPTLQEKTLVILLSTPIGAVLTDQMDAWEKLTLSLLKAQNMHAQSDAKQLSSASPPSALDQAPQLPAVLQAHLLTDAELRDAFSVVLKVPALLPAKVINDPLRKKKPSTIQ